MNRVEMFEVWKRSKKMWDRNIEILEEARKKGEGRVVEGKEE
jgi:hypothetical protein